MSNVERALVLRMEATLAKFERQMARATQVGADTATGLERRFANTNKRMADSAEASAQAILRELQKTEAAYEGLVASVDPAAAAAQKLARAEGVLAEALKRGTIDAKEHQRVMALVQAEYARATGALQPVARQAEAAAVGMGRFGSVSGNTRFVIQNTAAQIGDMAVQFESGTAASRILAQQLPQVAGGFGALGGTLGLVMPLLGTLAAIGIPIGAALLAMRSGAEGASEEVEDLASAMDAAEAAIGRADAALADLTNIEAMKDAYGELTEEVLSALEAMARLETEGALKAAGTALSQFYKENDVGAALSDALEPTGRSAAVEDMRREIAALEDQIAAGINVDFNRPALDQLRADLEATLAFEDIELDFGISGETAERISNLIQSSQKAVADGNAEAAAAALAEMREVLAGLGDGPLADWADQLAPIELNLRKAVEQARRAEKAIEDTTVETARAAVTTDKLLESYETRTRRILKLEEDRAALLAARNAASASEREPYRDAIAAIDEQIDALTDADDRLKALQETAADVGFTFDALGFDKGGDVQREAKKVSDAIAEAARNAGGLNDADLSALEKKLGYLAQLARDLAGGIMDASAGGIPERFQGLATGLGNADDGQTAAAALLRQFEGFRETPYWDVNALRTGYGSDTITLSDGTIQRVTEGMRVSVEDANRDLARRVVEFQDGIKSLIGADRFAQFTPAQQAALTSVAYNYGTLGSGPGGRGGAKIADVVRSGSNEEIAAAIRALASHNNGDNRDRRLTEAGIFSKGIGVEQTALRQEAAAREANVEAEREAERIAKDVARERERTLKEELRERERAAETRKEYLADSSRQIEQMALEVTLLGKSAAEQERARVAWELTNKAKREGIDLSERIAGSTVTYGEAIERAADAAAEITLKHEAQAKALDHVKDRQAAIQQAQESMKASLLDAVSGASSFKDALAGVAEMLARAAFQAALFDEGMFSSTTGGGGLIGGLVGAIGSAFGGRRAAGGPVRAGTPYLVNENTPRSEIMVPSVSGAILTTQQAQRALAGQMGAAAASPAPVINVHTTINAPGADAAALRRVEMAQEQMARALPGQVHQVLRNSKNRGTAPWR